MDFGKWALNNTKLVSFMIVVLIIGGFLSYLKMPKLEDPAIKVRQAMIVTTYPGASAHQVELEVTDQIEKAIREVASVDNVQSQSMNDLSIITVELQTTTKDIEQQWDMVRRKVTNVQSKLPADASVPIVRDDFGDVYGMFYALTGDGLEDNELGDYAELMKRELIDIDGVCRVDIYGKRSQCINIELHQDKMANLGVMPMEVIQTLNGQNKTVYAGYYDNGNNRIRVSVSDRFNNPEDIGNMLIQGHDDKQLRIRDIALVETSYENPTRNALKYDGERAIGISVACLAEKDVTKIGAIVEERLAAIENRLPAGVEYHKVFFQPERVSNALNTFLINLLESVLIVIVVLIFTMGMKSGLIIGMSLVTIVFGSFLILSGFDGTLQRVSLASFILAMGMLVDNAIVIVDGILVDKKKGKPHIEALTSIGRKTAMPLLGATLIAILAFLPIFMSPDTAGVYVRDLFIVIAVSLLLSWLLALTHVPIMCKRLLFTKKAVRASLNEANNQTDELEDMYKGKAYTILEGILRFGLNHRITFVIGAIALFAISAFCYKFLDQAFFPDMEYDQLYMEYKLPEGNNSTQVEKDLKEISEYLKTREEIKHITTSIGGTPSRYNLVRSIATPSLAYGELIIDFTSPSDLVDNIDEIQNELCKRYPQAYIKLKRYNLMYKKYPIEAMFTGPDPEVLHQLTDSAMAVVRKSDKVYLPTTDWEPRCPKLSVDYNQSAARNSGLSRSEVGTSVLAYTGGIPIATFFEGINPKKVYVKCVDDDGENIDNLKNVEVFGLLPNISRVANKEYLMKVLTGSIKKEDVIEELTSTTQLRQITSDIRVEWEDPVVMRYNGQRAQCVQCSPRPGVGTEEARASLEKELAKIQLPEGYTMSWQGEKKASDDSMKYLFANFPLAIILMIGILILLFKDYKKPAIIFCCIPLILTGVIPSVLISGKAFGFVAIVGVLGLIGMMIKNGIVLMDEINLEINSGMNPYDALINSSKSRLRPVMMASLTTILGMIPLVPDAMFGSLSVTIMGGLFMGTLITLIFIPVLYSLFFKVKA
ncbi:MAG: efflux RND transporter permease subunit [Bacteroidaceae bacterium]|nr:efflux RND transporter permease subunit [Bacteroidaceae bacterium]